MEGASWASEEGMKPQRGQERGKKRGQFSRRKKGFPADFARKNKKKFSRPLTLCSKLEERGVQCLSIKIALATAGKSSLMGGAQGDGISVKRRKKVRSGEERD